MRWQTGSLDNSFKQFYSTGGQRNEAASREKVKSKQGLFLDRRWIFCPVGNDLVEKKNSERGRRIREDNSRNNVLEKVRGNGLQSPSEGVGHRQEHGLFLHCQRMCGQTQDRPFGHEEMKQMPMDISI